MEQLPVVRDASQGRLPGSGLVISHLKNSHVREEKEKKKTNGLFEAYPIQYSGNLRARRPQVRMQISRQAEA